MAAVAAIGALTASLGLAGGAGASPARHAVATPKDPPPAVASPSNAARAGASVLAYWTPARMAAAKPAGLTMKAPQAKNARATNAGNTATGSPGLAGGSTPPARPRRT